MSEPPQQPYTPYAASAPKRRPRPVVRLGAVLMLLGLVIGMVVITRRPRRHRRGRRDHGQRQAAAIASPANRSRMLRAAGHAPPDCDCRRLRTGAAQAHDRGDHHRHHGAGCAFT